MCLAVATNGHVGERNRSRHEEAKQEVQPANLLPLERLFGFIFAVRLWRWGGHESLLMRSFPTVGTDDSAGYRKAHRVVAIANILP